ncbi:SCO1664 family protein [Tessaracoccus sp. OS52]|uniref:SCO1664 family protein n=1 Tax=Tessaracoccus sp. OS52 TaxID=2886691 RepID=UPI001D11D8CE|nr:SCO1664 family protein [Tessaracoccus sp. OS52]MCC2593210.1 SCO1664 family protein [Tessaracoccus sp. OS52]
MPPPGPVGELDVVGRLTEASNATFLTRDDAGVLWVYKPVAGERPLWDFPQHTLGRREVATHLLSAHFHFDVVPLTLWHEGPAGEGSVQRWVEGDITDLVDLVRPESLDETWLPVVSGVDGEDKPIVLVHRDSPALRRVCLFDLVVNNADRKAGHLISDGSRLFGVDHGVCLHEEDKHRTVLWGFAGHELDDDERRLLGHVATLDLPVPEGLTGQEWEAVAGRAEWLLEVGSFPGPSGRWPAIPWPPW